MKCKLSILLLLLSIVSQARDVTVRMLVQETGEPASGMVVMALTKQGSQICNGEETDIDGTYLLKGTPEGPYLIAYGIPGLMAAYSVENPADSLSITVQSKYVPRKIGEVDVSASSQYMTASKSVYVPTKRDKKMARGGGSLVQAMGISSLSVDPISESITMLSGQSVSKFIDYVPATEQDIANLRPMDVLRVELLESPSDPRFRGAQYVLNFVMVKYEYGGYTKLDADQYLITNRGTYNINSKLTKGKMTYDAAANFHYDKVSHAGSNQTSVYRFPEFNIIKTSNVKSTEAATRSGYGTVRATYSSDKALVTNTIGLNINKKPYTKACNSTSFAPSGIYADGMDKTFRESSSASPSWRGSYLWYLPKKFSIAVDPAFSFGHHASNNFFNSADTHLANIAKENNINYSLGIEAQKQLGKHSVSLRGAVSGSWDEINYSGSSSSRNIFKETGANISTNLFLMAGSGWLKINPYICYLRTSFNNYHKSQTFPAVSLAGGYTFNNKHKFNIVAQVMRWTVPVREQMPSFVFTTQIDAAQGNEALKQVLFTPVNFNYQWLMSKIVSLSLFADYTRSSNPITHIYQPIEYKNRPIMVHTYENSGFYNSVSYGGAVILRLLKNSLVIRGSLSGHSASRHNGINRSGTYLSYNFAASYNIKNFYCSLSYSSKNESVQLSSYTKSPEFCYLGCGWSNGKLNAGAYIINPFTSDWNGAYNESGDRNYTNYSQRFSIVYHRQVSLRISYSFSYGKKVQQTESIGFLSGTSSGILE